MKLPLHLRAIAALIVCFFAHVASAQVPSWARSGGSNQAELYPITTTDTDGNVYLAGGYGPGTHIGDSLYYTNGLLARPDFFIAKYLSDGTLDWVRHGGGENQDQVSSLRLDTDGNLYVAVSYFGDFAFQGQTLGAVGGFDADMAFMKLDPDGNVVWLRSIASEGVDYLTEMVVRNDGIYMQGQYSGTLRLDSTLQVTSAGDYDVFWAKYGLNGTPLWVRSLGGQNQDNPGGMGVDGNGDVVSAGNFYGTVSVSGTVLQPVGQQGSFLVKFTNAGSLIWAKSEATGITAMTLDPNGNLYTTGNFSGTQSFGAYPITSRGSYDGFLTKFNPNGVALWARSFGSSDVDFGFSLAYGGNGQVYVAGSYSNNARFGGLPAQASRGTLDGFVAAYSTSGDVAWVYTLGGADQDQLTYLSADPIGNGLFVSGVFTDSCHVGSQRLQSYGSQDWVVFKMDIPTAAKPMLAATPKVYPNPSRSGSTVTLPFAAVGTELIDATGVRHSLPPSTSTTLQLPEGLAPGLYRILSQGRSIPIVIE